MMSTQPAMDEQVLESTPTDAPPSYAASVVTLGSVESEATEAMLKDAIEKIGHSTQEIDIAFGNVSRGLAKTILIAQDGRRSHESHRLGRFKEDWDRYRNNDVELVWESRRIAGHVRTIAADIACDFFDVIKDDPVYPLEDKKQEIAAYRRELEKDKENAMHLSSGFINLQAAVMAFGHDSHAFIVQRTAEITAGIQNPLDSNATERPKKDISRIFSQSLKRVSEWHGNATQVMNNIATGIIDVEDDMDFIQEKLARFAQAWSTICSELSMIDKGLEMASTSNTEIRFEKRMKMVSDAFKTLSLALRLYETNVVFTQHSTE